MKYILSLCFLIEACAPAPVYLGIKAERDPDFQFYKTQTIRVETETNPTVAEKITKKKVEDWLAFKNFRLENEKPNYLLLVLHHEYESKEQILTLIPNFVDLKASTANSQASATLIQTNAVVTERPNVFKSITFHLYREKELEKYFVEKSSTVSPVWEATCSAEINDMEDYERKIIGTCMKAFPRSFKGEMKIWK